MTYSIRKYARHRNVSDKAVRKAISSGRITLEKDGTIDPQKADIEWEENTDATKVNLPSSNSSPSYNKIKTAHELYKAQITQLALQEKKGELINKEMVKTQIFQLGRQVRDSWLNWPARVSALMAAELGVDEHTLHITLEKYVREHLNDIGEGKLNL